MENITEFQNNPNFEFVEGDIRNFETCQQACTDIDYVLHQAAWGSVPRSIELPLLYQEINIKGTHHMLEAARQNGVKKFVYASSSSVYGDDPHLPRVEGREGMVLSPYALTKRVNEECAMLYTRLYGLETYGLRYFNVFGRRQNPYGEYAAVIPKFIKQLLANETPTIHGDGTQSRDFTYIINVIDANLRACAASKYAAGQVYNVAYGEQIPLNEVYYTLCSLLGKDITPIFEADRRGDVKHSWADVNRSRQFLHYSPTCSFEQGLMLALGWYKTSLRGDDHEA